VGSCIGNFTLQGSLACLAISSVKTKNYLLVRCCGRSNGFFTFLYNMGLEG
jgi:hypothetical protein